MSRKIKQYFNTLVPISNELDKKLPSLIKELLSSEWPIQGEVSVTVADDAMLQELNKKYLAKDAPTDVIAFNLSSEAELAQKTITADIYISRDRAKHQALDYGVSETEELIRLVAHGLLHALGYDHKAPKDKIEMERKQEFWVKKFRLKN